MENRQIIRSHLLPFLLLLLVVSSQASAGQKVLLKMPILHPSHLIGLGSTSKWFVEQVNKSSGGQVKVKLYEPGKLIPPKEILQAVNAGQVNSGYTTAGFSTGKLGAKAAIFTAVPFGPDAPEFLAWVYHGNGRKLWQEMYDDAGLNVHSIPCGILAPETSGWFRNPINKPEDLDGLRMRFFGLGALVMEKLGVSTSLLPGNEIFPALEKGVIDATEFSMPAIDQKLGFHKILKYNYYPGWHQPASLMEFLVNKKTWKKMNVQQQTIVENTCKAAMLDGFALGEAIQFPSMLKNTETYQVENRYWSEELLALFKAKWLEVVAEEKAKDPAFTKIWDDLSQFREGYRVWNNWAFLPRPGTKRIENAPEN